MENVVAQEVGEFVDGALGKEAEARLKIWHCFGDFVGVDDGGGYALVEEFAGKFGRSNWCAKETTSFEEFNADGRVGWVGAGGDGICVDGSL